MKLLNKKYENIFIEGGNDSIFKCIGFLFQKILIVIIENGLNNNNQFDSVFLLVFFEEFLLSNYLYSN